MINRTNISLGYLSLNKAICERNIELFKNLTTSFQKLATMLNETNPDVRQLATAINEFILKIQRFQPACMLDTSCNWYQSFMWWNFNRGYSLNVRLLMTSCNLTSLPTVDDHEAQHEHEKNEELHKNNTTDNISKTEEPYSVTSTPDAINVTNVFNSTLNHSSYSANVANSYPKSVYSPYSYSAYYPAGPGSFAFSTQYRFLQYSTNNPFVKSVWNQPNVRCTPPAGFPGAPGPGTLSVQNYVKRSNFKYFST